MLGSAPAEEPLSLPHPSACATATAGVPATPAPPGAPPSGGPRSTGVLAPEVAVRPGAGESGAQVAPDGESREDQIQRRLRPGAAVGTAARHPQPDGKTAGAR